MTSMYWNYRIIHGRRFTRTSEIQLTDQEVRVVSNGWLSNRWREEDLSCSGSNNVLPPPDVELSAVDWILVKIEKTASPVIGCCLVLVSLWGVDELNCFWGACDEEKLLWVLGNVVVEEASIWLSFVVKTELCVVKGEVRQKKFIGPKFLSDPN